VVVNANHDIIAFDFRSNPKPEFHLTGSTLGLRHSQLHPPSPGTQAQRREQELRCSTKVVLLITDNILQKERIDTAIASSIAFDTRIPRIT
jgi:hypothetical protein